MTLYVVNNNGILEYASMYKEDLEMYISDLKRRDAYLNSRVDEDDEDFLADAYAEGADTMDNVSIIEMEFDETDESIYEIENKKKIDTRLFKLLRKEELYDIFTLEFLSEEVYKNDDGEWFTAGDFLQAWVCLLNSEYRIYND